MEHEDLLNELREGRLDLASLAGRMSAQELVAWLARPDVRAQIAAICELGELQSRLVTSQYRSTVAARLLAIATGEDTQVETARRACVDALKLELADRVAMPLPLPGRSRAAALRAAVEGEPESDADGEAHQGGDQ